MFLCLPVEGVNSPCQNFNIGEFRLCKSLITKVYLMVNFLDSTDPVGWAWLDGFGLDSTLSGLTKIRLIKGVVESFVCLG